jgi:hypothetical protein
MSPSVRRITDNCIEFMSHYLFQEYIVAYNFRQRQTVVSEVGKYIILWIFRQRLILVGLAHCIPMQNPIVYISAKDNSLLLDSLES